MLQIANRMMPGHTARQFGMENMRQQRRCTNILHKVDIEAPIAGASLEAVSIADSIIRASWLPRKRDDEVELHGGSTGHGRPGTGSSSPLLIRTAATSAPVQYDA